MSTGLKSITMSLLQILVPNKLQRQAANNILYALGSDIY